RMLMRKFAKVRSALEDLCEYAKSINPIVGREYLIAADKCLKVLIEPQDSSDFYRSVASEYPRLEDPVRLAMVQLYWLLRHGCGLSGHESEVRVALIRNALWTKHGITAIPIRAKGTPVKSKGCDAVHVAVMRFKQGTAR